MKTSKKDASPQEGEAPKLIAIRDVESDNKNTKNKTASESIQHVNERTNASNWRSRMITDAEPPQAESLASFAGVTIVARGNYTTITGPKKTRKSLLAAWIISMIRGKVIVFDTEQSPYHVWLLRNRVKTLKCDDAEIIVVHLRGLSHGDKLRFIREALNDNPDVNFVMIDNVRDLVSDINDAKASHDIIEFLEEITFKMNVGMLVTIHQNKTNSKIRGHLGSELENKSFMVIQTSKISSQASNVSCESSRDGDFQSFTIRHQEGTGMPEVVNGTSMAANSTELTEARKLELWQEILGDNELGRNEILAEVKLKFGDELNPISSNRAKHEFNQAISLAWIRPTMPARSPNQRYRLSREVDQVE